MGSDASVLYPLTSLVISTLAAVGRLSVAFGSPHADIILCTSFASVLGLLQCPRDGDSAWAQLRGFLLPKADPAVAITERREQKLMLQSQLGPIYSGDKSTTCDRCFLLDLFYPGRGSDLSSPELTPTLDMGLSSSPKVPLSAPLSEG